MRPVLTYLFPKEDLLSQFYESMRYFYGDEFTNISNIDAFITSHYTTLIATTNEYDNITGTHLQSTESIVAHISKQMGLPLHDIMGATLGGALHDIGKIGIDYKIITKEGKLSDEERTTVEKHTRIGKAILDNLVTPWKLSQYAYMHHERLDGTGYPDKLTSSQIPLTVKILCVADVIDAVTADRPYRKGWTFNQAIDYLNSCGPQFDQDIVKVAETYDFDFYKTIVNQHKL